MRPRFHGEWDGRWARRGGQAEPHSLVEQRTRLLGLADAGLDQELRAPEVALRGVAGVVEHLRGDGVLCVVVLVVWCGGAWWGVHEVMVQVNKQITTALTWLVLRLTHLEHMNTPNGECLLPYVSCVVVWRCMRRRNVAWCDVV
jgi:hypothetical protein